MTYIFFNYFSNGSLGEICVWKVSIDDLTLTKLCSTSMRRRPICLALVDTSEYRKQEPIKDEQFNETDLENSDEEEKKVAMPRKLTAPLRSIGKVTIENDEDELNEIVQTLRTKSKKRKSSGFMVESIGDKREKTTKHAKINNSGFDITPGVERTKSSKRKTNGSQKKLTKTNSDDDDDEFEVKKTPTSVTKKSKKLRYSDAYIKP